MSKSACGALLISLSMFASAFGLQKQKQKDEAKKLNAGPTNAAPTNAAPTNAANYRQRILQGRVVYLAEAMARRYQVKSAAEAAERTLALETVDGQLFPLVEDVRGRAFRRDKRLRKMRVELIVRQYAKSPILQVVRVYEIEKSGKKLIIDYWCEVCSIPLFELKPCDCCQGPLELRKRLVKDYKPLKD